MAFISANLNSVLTTYTNVDWAGNYDNRSSTSTCICFLGPHLISWSSHKQRATARSSMEAEYRALSRAGSETIWLLSLCQELGLPICSPPTLLCDNLGATELSLNPGQHSRMKHLQIDLHFVHDMVQKRHAGSSSFSHSRLACGSSHRASVEASYKTVAVQDWSC